MERWAGPLASPLPTFPAPGPFLTFRPRSIFRACLPDTPFLSLSPLPAPRPQPTAEIPSFPLFHAFSAFPCSSLGQRGSKSPAPAAPPAPAPFPFPLASPLFLGSSQCTPFSVFPCCFLRSFPRPSPGGPCVSPLRLPSRSCLPCPLITRQCRLECSLPVLPPVAPPVRLVLRILHPMLQTHNHNHIHTLTLTHLRTSHLPHHRFFFTDLPYQIEYFREAPLALGLWRCCMSRLL